jgi:hypothetical protein
MTDCQMNTAKEPSEDELIELLADVPSERLPALLARFVQIAREHTPMA